MKHSKLDRFLFIRYIFFIKQSLCTIDLLILYVSFIFAYIRQTKIYADSYKVKYVHSEAFKHVLLMSRYPYIIDVL